MYVMLFGVMGCLLCLEYVLSIRLIELNTY